MTLVTPQLVKELRERTGVGMAKCKEALDEAKGDIELAIANLRKAGIASAVKKEGRETNEGTIKSAESASYLALVEINAETDFVVKNENFQKFADNVANQIAASNPASVDELLKQKYAKDPHLSVDEYRATIVQSLGENIKIRRLSLFAKKKDHSLAVYSHAGGKLVTLVEISGSSGEGELAKDIAMHIAAESPDYLSSDQIPAAVIAHEKDIARAQVKGKPETIVEKILDGKLRAFYDQVCLLNQKYVKNNDLTVAQLVEQKAKKIGKDLKIVQFVRWRVGE